MRPKFWLAAIVFFLAGGPLAQAGGPDVNELLHSGKIRDGESQLVDYLQKNPEDDQARFGLGAVQFLRSVEHLAQSLYRYGTGIQSPAAGALPFLRLPVLPNPNPEKVSYDLARKVFEEMLADLARAEATLAAIKSDDVALRIQLGPTRFDYDSDGEPDDSFQKILVRYAGGGIREPQAADSEVAFDRGDVAWLRGYCHLLSALLEFALAHDSRELFDRTAHLYVPNPDTPYKSLLSLNAGGQSPGFTNEILDVVAFIHLIRLPVVEPRRLQASLAHFEQVFALSRESWKFIVAETDDDHEWLPGPKQHGVLGVPVAQEQIDGWHEFLDEAESLLAGKRLAPFWRGKGMRGINLRKVFTEPQTFDLVLWIQGSAAVPYLEEGELTRKEVWDRLGRIFGGEFIGFALWFN